MKYHFCFVILASLLACGCDKKDKSETTAQPPVASQPPAAVIPKSLIESDPAASFKDFAAQFVVLSDKTYSKAFDPLPAGIDVRKTDSLLSPIVGVITLSYKAKSDGKGDGYIVKVSTLTFNIEDKKWKVQSAKGDTRSFDASGLQLDKPEIDNSNSNDRYLKEVIETAMPEMRIAAQICEEIYSK